ncbi:MAG: TetR/AcrR family transcriptional regulator C-terminal domain-containing protein [Planctomycetota bacterium]
MTRIKRNEVIDEALGLLDETGLDGVSTRRLAQRLGVESASLYWHFKNKSELLNEMSAAVLVRHHLHSPPERVDDWRDFILNNARSFRNALLAHRDGARLHAGTRPTASEVDRIFAKIGYLVRAGFTEHEAGMALYATSQFTIGCVLEEQARLSQDAEDPEHHSKSEKVAVKVPRSAKAEAEVPSATEAFEFGLDLLVQGLEKRRRPR